jgi:transketolase
MIKPEAKLNPKIFETDVEKKPIRDGFGTGVVKAGEENENVVVLTADLNESTRAESFSKKFPERFFEIGIAEQNLASVASGLAHLGKIPFATSYAMFNPGRNWEQIRTTVAYNNQPVKIVGSHAGLTTGADGGTHQALEDIALMRVIPNMVVISPCDAIEAEKATMACAKNNQPTYLRLGREKTAVITTDETSFEIGKANVLFQSTVNFDEDLDFTIFATGFLVHNALVAAKELSETTGLLKKNKLKIAVINIHTIKPLDTETILKYARHSKMIFTVEEHQIAGGMGSAIAEFLAEKNPIKIGFIGVKDKFGQSGKPFELIEKYGLDAEGIKKQILEKFKNL